MCPEEALGVLQLQREVLQGYYTAYFLSTLGKRGWEQRRREDGDAESTQTTSTGVRGPERCRRHGLTARKGRKTARSVTSQGQSYIIQVI